MLHRFSSLLALNPNEDRGNLLKQMAVLQYFRLYLMILLLCSHIPFLFVNSFKLHRQKTPLIQYTHDRFPEVKDKCGLLLSSRSKLDPDDTRGWRVKEELSFSNGDWFQDPGPAILMPFQDYEDNYASKKNILNLVSFQVVDVDQVHRMRDAVSVSGVLDLAIDRGILHVSEHYMPWSPEFCMQPGQSRLRVIFEGVYAESEEERLMCLLGTGRLPTIKQSFLDSPMEPMEGFGQMNHDQARGLNPSLVHDDQIMLVLKFPKALTLTGRGILGEMVSLNEKSDVQYFDRISISSQLMGSHLKYQFGAGELLKGGLDPYSYHDRSVDEEEELVLFKGDSLCDDLRDFVFNGVFGFVPSKEYKETVDKDQNPNAPFGFNFDLEHGLQIQDLRCHSISDQGEMTANVSAVFRLIRSWENEEMSKERTGLHGPPVFAAEGIWRSSSGKLCMIACTIELRRSTSECCNYRICLYMPRTFSLTHRSVVFGTISKIRETEGHGPHYHSTMRFEMPDHRVIPQKYQWNGPSRSYEYSRILEASSFARRRSPSMLAMLMRKFILQYPVMNKSDSASLSRLSKELFVNDHAVLHAPVSINLHVLSLGPFISWYDTSELKIEKYSQMIYLDERIPVAGHLRIWDWDGRDVVNASLAFEGVYDPTLGKMSLIGCRDVRAFRAVLTAEAILSLEGGKDCLIEVEVEYPPNNFGWLVNPTLKISITSKRLDQDSLSFHPVNLRILHIGSRNRFSDLLYRRKFERMLRVFLLSVSVFCIFSQLNFRAGLSSSRYISLSMLCVQAIGYCVPLITNGDVLFKWAVLQGPSDQHLNDSPGSKLKRFSNLDSAIRILLLVAFLLTLRLCLKVWDSRRISRNAKSSFKFHGHMIARGIEAPSKTTKLLLAVLAFHVVGLQGYRLIVNKLTPKVIMAQEQQGFDYGRNEHVPKPFHWLGTVGDYTSLVQDFFLLPQVLSNIGWKSHGKPLRKFYYMGLTIVRVMVRVYEVARDPLPDGEYGLTVYSDMKFDVYVKSWNTAVAIAMLALAAILYRQQQR